MKLGLYVGSFNPVHKDHIKIAKELIKKNILDKVIFIPSKNYWDKNNLIDIKDRIEMLKLYENENIIIDTKRYKFDYTYEVIKDIQKEYPSAIIHLIIGADNLEKFHLWKRIDDILKNKIIVINRNQLNTKIYIDNFKEKDNFIVVNNIKTKDISSTEIRNRINENKDLKDLLDEPIINYIKANKLYEIKN